MPTLDDTNSVLRLFGRGDLIRLAHDRARAAAGIAEKVWRPQSMQLPALAFVDRGSEDVPFDRVFRLREARRVANHAQRNIFGMKRMMQRDVDAEPIVAPVHVASDVM